MYTSHAVHLMQQSMTLLCQKSQVVEYVVASFIICYFDTLMHLHVNLKGLFNTFEKIL